MLKYASVNTSNINSIANTNINQVDNEFELERLNRMSQ